MSINSYEQRNGIERSRTHINTFRSPVLNLPHTQFENMPNVTLNPQQPQAPPRNPLPHISTYNNFPAPYVADRWMNPVGSPYSSMYSSYPPSYHQQPTDSRNMLIQAGIFEPFQYVDNIVRTFSSISAMLDSTLHAVQSSVYSILTVGDHVKQMVSHFGHIYSTISVIRLLKSALKKLLLMLRIRSSSEMSQLWKETAWKQGDSNNSNGKPVIPMSYYLLIIYLATYLLVKTFQFIMRNVNKSSWGYGMDNSQDISAKVLFNYQATRADELSIKTSQILKVAPTHLQHDSNWCLVSNGSQSGLVPINYILIDH